MSAITFTLESSNSINTTPVTQSVSVASGDIVEITTIIDSPEDQTVGVYINGVDGLHGELIQLPEYSESNYSNQSTWTQSDIVVSLTNYLTAS